MQKDYFKEVVHTLWPKTKKELQIALKNAKKMLSKGEGYLKDVSEKSVENARKLSLSLQREKLFYDLGKTVSGLSRNAWNKSKKISTLLKEIKTLDREIKKKPTKKKKRK